MINGNEPAINAFRLMSKKGISSVAIVDNEQRLVAVVSTSDLKVMLLHFIKEIYVYLFRLLLKMQF